ncbi:MAG: hypothetical protein AB3N28_04400 [Kordiimonas sp.]
MLLRLTYIFLTICFTPLLGQAFAQAIVVNPDSLPSTTVGNVISYETFFVNGVYTHGLTKNMAKTDVYLGNYYKTLLTFTTLRLVANDKIKLHESISFTLPNILERNPFRVAVTPHHILTETAGFAVPARVTDAPFEHYMSHVRTAGQMAHDDIVSWALLVEFLETKTGHSIAELMTREVLQPLNLPPESLTVADTTSPLLKLRDISGTGSLIAELTRLIIQNRTPDQSRFLPNELYSLVTQQQSWRMHPLTPNHTYIGSLNSLKTQRWLEPNANQIEGPSFMAFPEAGVAFVSLTGLNNNFREAVTTIALDMFLPVKNDNRQNEASMLVPYERFSGYYVRADNPTAWLKDRLQTINSHQLHIREENDGSLTVKQHDGRRTTSYSKEAPFHYTLYNGEKLTLSPFKSGGYLLLDGTLYRYAGILGNKLFVITLFPFVIIMLLSSGFYANSKTSKAWRRMGQFGLAGTLLICIGLVCDYLWWPTVLFDWNMPLLINLWRLALNIGLMLVLSLPLFAMSFVRQNTMPEGAAVMFVPLHLALISIAAAALFLILVAWGVAAEFSAY